MITYENFTVPNTYWKYVLDQYRTSFINEYYKKYNNYPSEEELQNIVLSADKKERYKRLFYSQYLATGTVSNHPNTPPVNEENNTEDDNPNSSSNLNKQNWLELPSLDDNNLEYYSHSFDYLGITYRNYSFGFSKEDCLSHWVAYPLCELYTNVNVSRTDAWAYDPILGWESPAPFRTYNNGEYARGTLVCSSERLCCYDANAQTFYGTNVVPQLHDHNLGVWSAVEEYIGEIANASLECYVIKGVLTNGSTITTYDSVGKEIRVPTHFYASVIYLPNDTQEWASVSILTEHKNYTTNPLKTSDCFISMSDLEKITNMTFFVNLKDLIGEEKYAKLKNKI